MLYFVTDECYRTGTAVLSFNIRPFGSPFLLVQDHFSQAKIYILVCFPCGLHYLCISSSLCSKVESAGQLQLNLMGRLSSEQFCGTRIWIQNNDRNEWPFWRKGSPCVITDVKSVMGWAIAQAWLCSECASQCAWGHVEARPQGNSLHGLHWVWNHLVF